MNLFEPPIDELVKVAGCRYAVAVIVGARAKDLENKIPALLNGSANLAIDCAAHELLKGEIVGVQSK
ncbi:MAG: DNA-directed RNA polymerase subunit omega [Candidatus Onthoplasma sp.]